MFQINKTLFMKDGKIFRDFKAKLTNSELWIGGGNARFKSTTLGPSILTRYGS